MCTRTWVATRRVLFAALDRLHEVASCQMASGALSGTMGGSIAREDRRNRLDVINAWAVSRRAIALGSVVRRRQLRLQCRL